MSQNVITIALTTRLKRKVFADSEIQADAQKLITENIERLGVELLDIKFKEYGMIIVLDNPEHTSADTLASYIRNITSGPIRNNHQQLQKMPSLWSKNFFCENGELSEKMNLKIEEFYRQ